MVDGLLEMSDSLLYRKLADDDWSKTDHLLALIHDQLAAANWQRASGGRRKPPRPKPISPLAKRGNRMGGRHGKSNDEVLAVLEKYRTGAFEQTE